MAKQFEFTQDYGKMKKGDVVEYNPEIYHTAQHPLLMRGILKDTEKEARKAKVKQQEKELSFDLNRDSRIDSEDAKLAGKVLAHQKQQKHGGK